MDKDTVKRISEDYEIEPSIVNDIYEILHNDERIKQSDIPKLMELICYDYMHLDVESNIEVLTDKKVNEIMNDEELNDMKLDIIDDEMDRINDLSGDLEILVEQCIVDYLDQSSNTRKDNFFDNLPRE